MEALTVLPSFPEASDHELRIDPENEEIQRYADALDDTHPATIMNAVAPQYRMPAESGLFYYLAALPCNSL